MNKMTEAYIKNKVFIPTSPTREIIELCKEQMKVLCKQEGWSYRQLLKTLLKWTMKITEIIQTSCCLV